MTLLNKNKKKTLNEEFKIHNVTTTNPEIISSEFCDFYDNIGPNLAEKK